MAFGGSRYFLAFLRTPFISRQSPRISTLYPGIHCFFDACAPSPKKTLTRQKKMNERPWVQLTSTFVAFIKSPLIFSPPVMNRLWACALPSTRFPKSSSFTISVTCALLPSGPGPLPTNGPLAAACSRSRRSMYHDCCVPPVLVSVKTKSAPPPDLSASDLAASSDSAVEMASKALLEGKEAVGEKGKG